MFISLGRVDFETLFVHTYQEMNWISIQRLKSLHKWEHISKGKLVGKLFMMLKW